jgi:aminodeoxyfutalosine synthase
MTRIDDLLKEDILTLGMRADDLRRSGPSGSRVLYQRVHIVRAADVKTGFTVPEPATEVRLLDTPETLEDALNLVRAVKEGAGDRVTTAFSLADVEQRATGGWGDIQTVLTELAAAGLADVAELPVDRIDDLCASVGRARDAGLLATRLTVENPFADRKNEILDRMRLCLRDAGEIRRVSPLPRNVAQDKPTTGYEDVRMVAIARLVFGNVERPPFIEVDWQIYGPKLAQVALTFGADFLDAVPATSDESLGKRRQTVEDVERNIRAAGFEPQEYSPV